MDETEGHWHFELHDWWEFYSPVDNKWHRVLSEEFAIACAKSTSGQYRNVRSSVGTMEFFV